MLHMNLNYQYAKRAMMDQRRGYAGSKRGYVDVNKTHMSQPPSKRVAQGSQNGSCNLRNTLPSGWLDCPPCGNALGFIIPSKVPLDESFNDKIVGEKRYSPKHVILQQRRLGRELGLVIDLTNTDRYYRESDWETRESRVKYVKIRCAGRDSVPDNESVERFIHEVTWFRSQHALDSNKYVLVHCTRGHNRTGYMIVHYLIRSEAISLNEALSRFSRARPPGIYKQDYVDHLCNFFGEQLPRTFVCPHTPEWKKSPDRDDDVAHSGQGNVRNEMTNDDILGDEVPLNKMESLRQFCNKVLEVNSRGRTEPLFPGSHPVSLCRENLQLLRQHNYRATWKADGTRYMMLITRDGCYLIDRKFHFRSVQLRFPCRNVQDGTHNYTLLDGEMVIDTDPVKHTQERRYLVYDLIAINEKSLVYDPFYRRWETLQNEVINPRNKERETFFKSKNPYYRYDLELFRVRRKDFYRLSYAPWLLKDFIPRLSHASDGLIFQPWNDRYVPLTHRGLLKWKYPEMNSVDFLLEVGNNNRPLLYLNERGERKLINGTLRDPSVDIFSLSGKIIECSWDSRENVWVFMRMRPDKSKPNEFSTYKKVMRSIKDNITEEAVLVEIQNIIRLPMYAA